MAKDQNNVEQYGFLEANMVWYTSLNWFTHRGCEAIEEGLDASSSCTVTWSLRNGSHCFCFVFLILRFKAGPMYFEV